ncbi:MAG: Do family serine endopeptidase [Magnetospirillum sp. WYHS-4]
MPALHVVLAVLAVLATALPALAGLPMLDEKRGVLTIAPVVEKATPAVVNISVATREAADSNPLYQDPFFRRFFGAPERQERDSMSAGSGVIVDAAKGYVLTNHHVVEGASDVTVTLKDGRALKAKLVGSDPETDIALLQVKADRLQALPFGSSDSLQVGDLVIAIGNPFGLGQTVTSGIVSALGRSGLGIEGYEDFIQTDASINPGNSGGALIDSRGELVGINTAILGPSGGNIGIGFAVPVAMARSVMDQLAQNGQVRRGIIGVAIQDVTPEIAEAMGLARHGGALVTKVEKGTSAEAAGLKQGDVIIALDARPIKDAGDLRNRVGMMRVGDAVEVVYLRGGRELRAVMKVGARKAAADARPDAKAGKDGDIPVYRFAGARFAPLLPGAPGFGIVEGVLVLQIDPAGKAAAAGLAQGDIVVAVDRQPVRNPLEMAAAVDRLEGPVPLAVLRNGSRLSIVVR